MDWVTADSAMTDQKYDYDFFVIGGGSGGVRAARVAAQFGELRVEQLTATKPTQTCQPSYVNSMQQKS